jgi:predicted ABC-type ATPase
VAAETPRLRLFAGPNGSGKSVLKSYLPEALLGVYLNPDEVEAEIRRSGGLNLRNLGVEAEAAEVLPFFTGSSFLRSEGLGDNAGLLRYSGGRLDFRDVEVNAYFASVAVDFLRKKLLEQRVSFTFESVMSHPSKVELLAEAQQAGYRTYLYYVATDDPEINVSRVRNRVALGGHAVPEDKIVSRYHRSLNLLMDAIKHTNRAYIFDNSTDSLHGDHTWLAEITDGRTMELKTDLVPAWFKKAVLDKVS